LFENELKPVAGVLDILPLLPQAKAVVSSGPLAKISKALEVTGLTKYFENNIYSSYEVGIWKPDPGIYSYAARDMGFEIEQCVAIEDSPTGVAAATACGMRTYFLNRFEDLCEFDNVIEIQSMSELPALINH